MTEVRELLSQYVDETLLLRYDVRLPDINSITEDVLSCLLDVRSRLDRIEELLSRVTRLRARAKAAQALAQATYDDAWDEAIHGQRTSRSDDYSSAKERAAEANLSTIDLRRTTREAADMTRVIEETHDVIRLAHQGLNGIRQDLLVIIRVTQVPSNLER